MRPRQVRLFFSSLPLALTTLALCFLALAFMAPLIAAAEETAQPPTVVRIAVLNASGSVAMGDQVAFILGEHARREMENIIGMRLELVNISLTNRRDITRSQILYGPGFMHAALIIAKFLPGDQLVRAMLVKTNPKLGIDLEILVGKDKP